MNTKKSLQILFGVFIVILIIIGLDPEKKSEVVQASDKKSSVLDYSNQSKVTVQTEPKNCMQDVTLNIQASGEVRSIPCFIKNCNMKITSVVFTTGVNLSDFDSLPTQNFITGNLAVSTTSSTEIYKNAKIKCFSNSNGERRFMLTEYTGKLIGLL